MLSRVFGIALLVSLLANAGLGLAYRQSLIKQGEIRSTAQAEAAEAANNRMRTSLELAQSAYDARVTELQRRLEQSDRVSEAASARQREAADALERLQSEQNDALSADPSYREWANTPLPDGVAERLEELQ